jgi:aryl-alcohol dehydrogenase-like predicted oxidoreductase
VYAGLHDTVETCRNTCCHGGIHKRGAAIAVHVERIGAVPTALTSEPRRISMFIRLRRSRSPTSPGSVSTSMAATDSVIGLGTWPLGGRAYGPVSCANATATIAAALHAGTSFFDTADIYGDGRAEELLGAALPPPGCLVATKVGYLTERGSDQDFGPQHITAALHVSSRRLRRAPHLLLLHSPPRAVLERGDAMALLDKLRERGDVARTGVSVRDVADVDAALAWPGCSAVEVIVNLLDQRAVETGALARAREHGVEVIARVPLCFGWLSDTGPPSRLHPGDHRLRWPPEQRERWARGAARFEFLRRPGRTLAQAAIAFCAALPGVTRVVPGARTPAQTAQNAAALDGGRALSQGELERALALGPLMTRETVPRSSG